MKKQVRRNSPNIILITIDSLRYDHLGCYGYHRNTSPNIDALAARGVKFLQAISNGGQTPQAFPSILASTLPPMNRTDSKALLEWNTSLAMLLREVGYRTAAFHSNPYLSQLYGYAHGFDVFDENYRRLGTRGFKTWISRMAESNRLMNMALGKGSLTSRIYRKYRSILPDRLTRPIINAKEITNKAILCLENHRDRYFLWLHYMDVHNPYAPEPKYLNQFCTQLISRREMKFLWQKMLNKPGEVSQSELEILINLYDGEISYTDEIIGWLLHRLENTMVIVTADHGDEFGEHGRFGHNTVYDELLHVPLIMAGPGIEGGVVIKNQVSLIDLAPTITDLVGIENPRSFQGESLLPTLEGQNNAGTGTISTYVCLFGLRQRNIAYRTPDWKYILTESLDEGHMLREELYDLENDPGETNNLHGVGNEEANIFELEAKRKIAQFKHLKTKGKTDYEKQRIRAKLSRIKKL